MIDKILDTFRPFIDSLPHAEYLWSNKWACWVYVRRTPEAEEPRFLECAENLLCSLVGDFFDQADGRTATEAADNALAALRPYLDQLPPEMAEYAVITLGIYKKMDELPAL